ncbi:MAG: histidine phosphatase family protein [Chloroflexota bacterium]|nr:histidine phosphatase family protein [Chloroflexota bacterium]
MKHLVVLTHPEATHHVAGLVGGWHDSALTPRGREQAGRIAVRLREAIPTEAHPELYTSDLQRCLQTAEVIAAALHTPMRIMPDLREVSYGEAEGKPQAWLDARFVFPPAVGNQARLDHQFGVAGAETRREVATRVYRAMDVILACPAEYQVIVTHGFALTFVVAAWIGMPLEAAGLIGVPVSSGSITTLRQEPPFHNRSIVALNDTSHLA